MVPPPRSFRLVYRAFDRIAFDPEKSVELFEYRGFDLVYASRIFPGYVLEREDTRFTHERRFQVIGDVFGDVLFVVYTKRNAMCRLITAWRATPPERKIWYDYTS